MLVSKAMPNTTTETPDWLREMETILEELNEGVVVVDDQLRVIFANEALTRMGHFERGEIQGRTPDAIFPSEDLPYIKRQHESGHRYGRHRSEFYLPRKDRTKIPAIFSGRVIQGPDKQEYVLLVVTDISAQKGIEEQLRESNSLLQKRQDEMDGELALAAHVQQSLAPRSLIWKNLAVEAYYSPARTIGGDFGVVHPQGDDSLSIVLSDVSGHGVGSALMANRIYSETCTGTQTRARNLAAGASSFRTYADPGRRVFLHDGRSPFQPRWTPTKLFCRQPAAGNTRLKWQSPPA